MKIEKGKISEVQATFMVAGFIFGSAVLITPAGIAGRDAWFAETLGLIEGMGFALAYAQLVQRFPGKTLMEINEEVFGKVFGFMMSLFFLVYLFHLNSMIDTNYLDFIKLTILPATPAAIVVFFGVLPCIYTAKRGVEVIARVGQILFIMLVLFISVLTMLLVTKLDFSNLKPFLTTPLPKLLWAAHVSGNFPFLETVSFLMILPFMANPKKAKPTILSGLAIGGTILVLIVTRTTLLLGDSTPMYVYPAFHSTRLVNLGNVLSRLEVITAISFLMMGFFKMTVLLYGTSLGCAQLFRCQSYQPFVIPLGILTALISLVNFHSVSENLTFINQAYPLYALPFGIILPVLALTVAGIRKLPRKG